MLSRSYKGAKMSESKSRLGKIKYIFEMALAKTPDSPIDIIQILAFNATCKWALMVINNGEDISISQTEFYKHYIEAINEVLTEDVINKYYELYKDHNRITAPGLVQEITNKINVRVAITIHEEHKQKQKQITPFVSPEYMM